MGGGRRRSWSERRRLEAGEKSGHLIARLRVAGTAAAQRRPRFVIPRDDVAGAVEPDALIDDEREAEVFVRHFVLARKLHAHGTADGLRQQRRIVGNRIGAVDAVAARAARVDHLHLLRLHAEHHRAAVALRIDALRRRPDGRAVRFHIRDGARRADRSVHLIRMQIRRAHDLRRFRERGVDVFRVDEEACRGSAACACDRRSSPAAEAAGRASTSLSAGSPPARPATASRRRRRRNFS